MSKVRMEAVRRRVLIALSAVGGAWIVVFLVIASLSSPIADDYRYFAGARQHGVLGFVWYRLATWDGRFTSVLIVSAGYRAFGAAAVPVLCGAFLLFLAAALVLAAWQFLPVRGMGQAVAVGTTATAAILSATPSPFDSFFWLTSAVVYIPPLAWLLINSVLVARLLTVWKQRTAARQKWLGALVCLSVFLAAGFHEPIAITTLCVALIVLAVECIWRPWGGRRLALLAVAIAAAAGVAVLFAAAASRMGRLGVKDPFGDAIKSLVRTFSRLVGNPGPAGLLGFLALALVVLSVTKAPSRAVRWTVAGIGLGSIAVVAPAIVFVTGFTAGSMALRGLVIPTAILGLGFSLMMMALGWSVPRSRGVWLAATALVLVVVMTAVNAHQVMNLTRAVALRGQLAAQRDTTVRAAVTSKADAVYIQPAPILAKAAAATDVSFVPDRKNYMMGGYLQYMRIPKTMTVIYLDTQPDGYCLDTAPPAWSGAETCDKLAAR